MCHGQEKQKPVVSTWVREASTFKPTRSAPAVPLPRAPDATRGKSSGLSRTFHDPPAQRARVPAPLGASLPICCFKAAACRPCLPSATRVQWRRKIKMLASWGEKRKKEENLKDSVLEAYVLESLQPVPCQENIGQVGRSDLCGPRWFLPDYSVPALGVARNKG